MAAFQSLYLDSVPFLLTLLFQVSSFPRGHVTFVFLCLAYFTWNNAPPNFMHVASNDRILLFLWWKYAIVPIHGTPSGLSLYFARCTQSWNEQAAARIFLL